MKNKTSVIFSILAMAVMISPAFAIGRQSFGEEASIELAADAEFSNPGMLPDNPLYFLKRFGENVRLFFASEQDKPFVHLQLAKQRLSEAKKLAELNSTHLNRTIEEFGKEINLTKGLPDAERDNMIRKSSIVLDSLIEKVPERARPAILKALDMSSKAERRKVCIQVITTAAKDGVCKEFPTPCDVPAGWEKVDKCDSSDTGKITAVTIAVPSEGINVVGGSSPARTITSSVSEAAGGTPAGEII